jgi:hypothetical protein
MRWTAIVTGLFLCGFLLPAGSAEAANWVRLKNGRIIECAVLRQDTTAVFTTDWKSRHSEQPPLQVFALDEVESIWFTHPGNQPRGGYVPHVNGWEFGGSAAFQSWASNELERRYLLLFSLHGGYTILPMLSFELDGDFTFPLGGRSDSTWKPYGTGYQTVMNIVAHPFVWKGIVPYLTAGGGVALDVPVGGVVLTDADVARNLVDIGIGIKWGSGGIGYRIEWRHHLYQWTPDAVDENGVRVPSQSADASVIRASLFIYR